MSLEVVVRGSFLEESSEIILVIVMVIAANLARRIGPSVMTEFFDVIKDSNSIKDFLKFSPRVTEAALEIVLSSTTSLMASYILATIGKDSEEVRVRETSIVGGLLKKKYSRLWFVYLFTPVILIAYVWLAYAFNYSLSSLVLICIVSPLVLTNFNTWILKYRLKKGFYGNNAYETAEIISLLIKKSDHDDFSGFDGKKKLFPDPEPEKMKVGDLVGEVVR